MAEFKLGRIRFVWQGDWSAGTSYVADDVVSNGGKSYICIKNHTASTEFNTDFTNEIPKWDIVSDGTSWRGDWQTTVEYNPGDVVKYGANVYICEEGHTSATFVAPTYLGLESDIDKWTPFATSFDWRSDWDVSTRYKINDLVKYGGYVYVCNAAHVSAGTTTLGLEQDQAKWTLFSDGIVYTGEWNTAVRYRVNDVVKYGGNVFICTAPHTSADFLTEESNWDVFIEGFQFEDSWNSGANYQIGDTVTYGGYVYVAKTNNANSQPTSNPLDWEVFTTGFKFQGDWLDTTEYKVGDVVRLSGNTYVAVADNDDQEPPNGTYWSILNQGLNWTNNVESFLQVSGINVSSSGSGARFDVTRSKTVYTVGISTGYAGTGYEAGDTIKIEGANVGGSTPANDITITVDTVTAGAITGISHVGYSSTWKASVDYHVGDVVQFGGSSFICITKHTSSAADRPDLDLDAVYWNLLTLGSEALALTTPGDLVYYGNNGPTRLPIGIDGQILRVTDGFPDWANYGLIDNVVYVGPLGTDRPAPESGLTIDKPWGSVRYALEQVRDGYLNPQTRDILKNNKEFLMKELTQWIKYTYRVTVTSTTAGTRNFYTISTANLRAGMPIVFDEAIGGITAGTEYYVEAVVDANNFRITETVGGISFIPTTDTGLVEGNLSYNEAKCERDTGYIVDALIYDISRGGTLKTTNATKAYYTQAGNEYINSNLGNQRLQTVEAYEQLKVIVGQILNNEQPLSYQSLMEIPESDRAVQVIDFNLTAEETGKSKANDLMDIVTIGIAAESNTATAAAINPNTTVFIKTGTYNEILPIVVPEYTAIVGDELRTSVVQPAPAIPLLANDKNKTTSALNRIKSVIPDLMQNIEIDKSATNGTLQGFVNGYGGNTTSTNRLNVGTNLIADVLKDGLGVVEEHGTDAGPTPTGGSNNASVQGFADAKAQIEANYDFIKKEITSWISVQIAGSLAPFTGAFTYDAEACERDVGYILDALLYDLTYGGNLETIVAARAYFVDGSPVYGAGEKDETLAAYTHLKNIVSDVITETAITPSTGNDITQNTDGEPGSAAADTFAQDRIQEIFDTIDTDGTLPTEVLPDTSWVSSTLTTVNTQIVAEKTNIQNSVIDFINSTYGDFTYDSAKCRRDSGLLQKGAAYDVALGTNFNAVRDGLSYRRGMAEKVLDEQLTETVGAITQEGSLVEALMSDSTAIARNTDYWNEVIDIIENGEANANALVFGNTGTTAKDDARTQLQTNRQNIIDDLTAWITTNYPNLVYSSELCERDTGYIVDAISYDINYGGNSASYEAARAYFDGYASVLPVSQREYEVAALDQLIVIVKTYMTGATEEAEAETLIGIVRNVVNSGSLLALPTKTYPTYTFAAAGIQTDADAILGDTTVVPAVLQYITDNYNSFVYNHAKCSRDVGYMVDALRYDIMFGSDFRSLKSGMSYRRGLTSTGVVLDDQLEATLGTITHVRTEINDITNGTDKVTESTDIIKDILISGTEPTSFTIPDPTNYDTGFYNARRLIVANKTFLQDEIEAYMDTNYNSLWTSLSAGDQAKCLRDMGYIVDALEYDLTYRGNLETIVVARSYYSEGVFVEPSDQKTAALAVQARIKDIIDDIATGNAITRSTGNVTTQDVSGTAGSAGAAAFAQDRIQEIYDTIDSGLSPAAINPTTAWVDSALVQFKSVVDSRKLLIQEGAIDFINFMYPDLTYDQDLCKRDVGYMIDAIVYDVLFGSDFRSSKAGMAYLRGLTSTGVVLDDQLEPTISTVDFINEALIMLTEGTTSEVSSPEVAISAKDKADTIKKITLNGLEGIPAYQFPQPTGYNTDSLSDTAYATTTNTTGDTTTYADAVAQLVANRAFIQDEVRHWLEDSTNTYDVFWGTLSADAQDRCIRDVGYIVDAIRYDMTYGGNTQSLVAGSAYYSGNVLTIDSGEIPATLAAYGRMKTVIAEVIAETTVTTSPGVTETQDVSGSAGNANAVEFAEERVDDILDWINNNEPNATIEIATEWASVDAQQAFANLTARKDEIVEDVVYWVEKNWQEIRYNQDICRRDAGLMADAVARDTLTGSNFASIKAGMSYYRQIASTAEVRNDELEATVGSINFLGHKVKHIAANTAAARASLIIDDITATINGGAIPALKWQATTSTDANDVAAAELIWENKAFIQAEVKAYLDLEFPNIVYSEAKCLRDVGYLVDALRYDLTYGGSAATLHVANSYYLNRDTLQIDADDQYATGRAYEHVKFLVEDIAVNGPFGSPGILQTVVEPVYRDDNQTVGDANSATRAGNLVQIVTTIVDNGVDTVNAFTIDSISSNTITTTAAHGLSVGDYVKLVQVGISPVESNGLSSDTTLVVHSVPTTTTYTVSEYYGGVQKIDLTDGTSLALSATATYNPDLSPVSATLKQQYTNLQGSKSTIQDDITLFIAESYPTLDYDVDTCERDVGLIIDAVGYDMMLDSNYRTVTAALAYYRGTQAAAVLGSQRNATVQSFRQLKNEMTSYITSTDGVATKRINNLMDIVIDVLDQGEGVSPEMIGTVNYFNDIEVIKGADILKANKNFLAHEATGWVKASFGGEVTSIANVPAQLTFSQNHNFQVGDPIVFDEDAFGGAVAGTTYYVIAVDSPTELQISDTVGGDGLTLAGGIGSSVVTYSFDEAACRRDMERYVDAIVYDLQYPGNFKALRAAELYLNAVNGSERSDMFYLRNSTGVRNQTLNGLRGNLTEENTFGTRRPTAGAYASLDPGFGPNDSEAWITNKSPYVQNVTTFGVGCVGCKIDGALHSGGNRSIVSNDFTQVLSDGIGVWCSGNNSLTELVSVFCYYNYSGYLADLGGRIRATNGNSSYGTYGVIAEGTDTGEVPLYATVDNNSQDAIVGEVLTDGTDEVLRFEFSNAGRNYTNVQHAISGAGFNAATVGDEFRDSAIFETRLVDLDDGNGVGGADYNEVRNVAQGGDLVSATIAATDTALSNEYNGMLIIITAGTGVGQFARVLSYNNGTKVAKVYKDSVDTLTVTATTATGNTITVADTSSLYVNMPIYLGSAVGGLSATTVYYVTSIPSGTTFTVSTSEGGSNETVTTTTGQSVTLYPAGWDHVIPGTPIEAGLDLTTGYSIEPNMGHTAPGSTSVATTTDASVAYQAAAYADGRFVALQNGGTGTSYSEDGTTWSSGGSIASANWAEIAFGGGSGAEAEVIIGGLGGSGAILEAELGELNSIGLPGPTQVRRINVIDGGSGYTTPPTITLTATLGGDGATAVCTVLNGIIQEVILTSTGAGYGAAPTVAAETDKVTEIKVNQYGSGYNNPPTVTISGGGSSDQAQATAVLENTGVIRIDIDLDGDDNPIVGSGYTSQPTITITDSAAKFVAIADGSTDNASLALSETLGANWTAGTALPNSNFKSITYGSDVWVAIGGTGGVGSAATSTDGSAWVSRTTTTLAAGSFSGVAYGQGTFVAVATGTNETATSSNGIIWTAGGNMPATSTWSSIAYGNGRFVAIANGGRDAAYSVDEGATWYEAPAQLPSSESWTTVKYGQGLFVAVAEGTDAYAYSYDGVTWRSDTFTTSGDWHALAFGNPDSTPTWIAITDAANNVANRLYTGAKATSRVSQEDGALTEVRMIEPGSGYPKGSVTSTTAPGTITLSSSYNLLPNQPITFTGCSDAGLEDGVTYYIANDYVSGNTISVSLIADSGIDFGVTTATFTEGSYKAGPITTVTDPSSTLVAPVVARQGDGALGNPTFTNRGTGYQTATCELSGDGFADLYQPSTFLAVEGLFDLPEPGSNVEFANIPNTWYKLVAVSNVIGQAGEYTATLQLSPGLEVLNAPDHGTLITTTNKYSQVRLTGHDYLYIGTGNQADTNYPYVDITTAIQDRQQLSSGGGRVFFTSTDQDGNFNVGNLFGVQQSTGTATLDADAFNLAGLQSLQLQGIGLGIGSAIITQFSTDPFFTANSDSIVPTQRAIKSYITAQIGGGQSSLNVNTLTAGVVFIANDEITTTNGGQLNIKAKMNFTGGIDGAPVALGFFLAR